MERYGGGIGLVLTSDRTSFLGTARASLEDVRTYHRPLARERSRHGSTKIAERFYARIRAGDAFCHLERTFHAPEVLAVPKKNLATKTAHFA